MGIFDFLKNKKNKMGLSTPQVSNAALIKSTALSVNRLTIHHDLRDLVWIGDGKYKNYTRTEDYINSIELNGLRLTISFMKQEEPSLIYTNQKISQPRDIKNVQRPPYYPTYSGLTPEQKWIYLNLLINPYDSSIDIGFVFILYYGLERHLLSGNYEKAIDVIIKLRDVHTNKSFQSYSANAIILSCILHQRGDLALQFIESLDKEHELAFSDNLFLICYFSFDLPLLPKDIMRMAKTFEVHNNNYIRKYPDLFLECLKDIIQNKVGANSIDLKRYLTTYEVNKLKKQDVRIFANMSISDKTVPIPLLSENFKLKREIYGLLEAAHEGVKKKLIEMRKAGIGVPENRAPSKKRKEIIFNEKQEKILLAELSANLRNPVNRHFNYIDLQNFYYKYRSIDEKYIDKCIQYCILDINTLSEMTEAYVSEEIKRTKEFTSITGTKILKDEIQKIKERGFIGNIPAFKRLAIIYEKQGRYNEAIEVCDKAIAYGQSVQEFRDRKQKLEQKKNVL
jgi:hypothetical protein